MGITIATINMKGGVGKTTLSVNLATCLAKYHQKRVLIIDLDTQISATLSLMSPQNFAKTRREKMTISYLVAKVLKPSPNYKFGTIDTITRNLANISGLDLLSGDIDIYDEFLVSEKLHREALAGSKADFMDVWNGFESSLLREIIAPIQNDYDFIILDCAPGYNLLTRSGIMASDYYIMPARPEPLSLVGMQLLERRIASLREAHQFDDAQFNSQLLGIVFVLSGNTLFNRYYDQVMQRVAQDFQPEKVFQTKIPMDANVARSIDSFQPVVVDNPNTPGSKAFMKVTQEFLQKIG